MFLLENPGDRGAWWAAVSGVAQSQTRLKRLSSSSSSLGTHLAPDTGRGGSWTRIHQQGLRQKVNNKNFDNRLDNELSLVLEEALFWGQMVMLLSPGQSQIKMESWKLRQD